MTVVITHCDKHFLSRALALADSLGEGPENPEVWIVAQDQTTLSALKNVKSLNIKAIDVSEILMSFPQLKEAKTRKSHNEFLFAITPFLILYAESITDSDVWYIDADMYFLSKFSNLLEQTKKMSVVVSAHNFPLRLNHLEIYGKYNVGIVYVSGNSESINAIRWWSEKCLQDTSLFESDEVYGDQKYLDQFPNLLESFSVFKSVSDCCAPWNIESLSSESKIISFHFSGFRKYKYFLVTGLSTYYLRPKRWQKEKLFFLYSDKLTQIELELYNSSISDSRRISLRNRLRLLRFRDLILHIGTKCS